MSRVERYSILSQSVSLAVLLEVRVCMAVASAIGIRMFKLQEDDGMGASRHAKCKLTPMLKHLLHLIS